MCEFLALVSAGLSYDGLLGSSSCVMNWGWDLGAFGEDAMASVFSHNITTGGSAVDVTIFWSSLVVVTAWLLHGKSCMLCVFVSHFSPLFVYGSQGCCHFFVLPMYLKLLFLCF